MQQSIPSCRGVRTFSVMGGNTNGDASQCTGTDMMLFKTPNRLSKISVVNLKKKKNGVGCIFTVQFYKL